MGTPVGAKSWKELDDVPTGRRTGSPLPLRRTQSSRSTAKSPNSPEDRVRRGTEALRRVFPDTSAYAGDLFGTARDADNDSVHSGLVYRSRIGSDAGSEAESHDRSRRGSISSLRKPNDTVEVSKTTPASKLSPAPASISSPLAPRSVSPESTDASPQKKSKRHPPPPPPLRLENDELAKSWAKLSPSLKASSNRTPPPPPKRGRSESTQVESTSKRLSPAKANRRARASSWWDDMAQETELREEAEVAKTRDSPMIVPTINRRESIVALARAKRGPQSPDHELRVVAQSAQASVSMAIAKTPRERQEAMRQVEKARQAHARLRKGASTVLAGVRFMTGLKRLTQFQTPTKTPQNPSKPPQTTSEPTQSSPKPPQTTFIQSPSKPPQTTFTPSSPKPRQTTFIQSPPKPPQNTFKPHQTTSYLSSPIKEPPPSLIPFSPDSPTSMQSVSPDNLTKSSGTAKLLSSTIRDVKTPPGSRISIPSLAARSKTERSSILLTDSITSKRRTSKPHKTASVPIKVSDEGLHYVEDPFTFVMFPSLATQKGRGKLRAGGISLQNDVPSFARK